MRETILTGADGATRTVVTDDRGTTVTDAAGVVLREHGTDLHDVTLEELAAAGWQAPSEPARKLVDAVAPAAAADPPDGQTATVRPENG